MARRWGRPNWRHNPASGNGEDRRGPPLKGPLELRAGGHGGYGVGRNGGGRGTCRDLVGAWRGSTAYRTLPVLRGPKPVRMPRPGSGFNSALLQ